MKGSVTCKCGAETAKDIDELDNKFCVRCYEWKGKFRCFDCCVGAKCEDCDGLSSHECDCEEDTPCFEDILVMEDWTRKFIKRARAE